MSQVNDQNDQLKYLEFTPIGQPKQAPKRPFESPTKNYNENYNGDTSVNSPPRKYQRMNPDDTLNSVNMFNESLEFDEVIPELPNYALEDLNVDNRHNTQPEGRNIVSELKENALASNPLKEQQEQIQNLVRENYNLKAKVTSLLKYLNTVMNKGELQKTLPLLDEINELKILSSKKEQKIHELKVKCDDIITQNSLLNKKIKELEGSTIGNSSSEETKAIQMLKVKYKEEMSTLENQLKLDKEHLLSELDSTKEDIENLRSRYNDLEGTLDEKVSLIALKDNSINSLNDKVDQLENEIQNLSEKITAKDEELKQQKDKFDNLVNSTSNEQEIEYQKELTLKITEIDVLTNELKTLTDLNIKFKDQLDKKETEIVKLSTEYEKYRLDNELDVDNAKKSDYEFKMQLDKLKKKNITLDTKLLHMNEENEKLSTELTTVKNNLETELTKCKEEIVILKKSNETLKIQHQQEKQDLDDSWKVKLDERTKEIIRLKGELREIELAHTVSNDQLNAEFARVSSDYKQQISELQEKLNSATENLSNNNTAQIEEYQKEIQLLNEDLKKKNSIIKSSERLTHDLKTQLIDNVTNSSEKYTKITEDKNQEIESLMNQIENLRLKHRKDKEDLLLEQESERKNYINKIKDLRTSLNLEKQKYEDLLFKSQSEKNSLLDSKNDLEDSLNMKISSLEKKLELHSSNDSELHNFKSKLNEKASEIEILLRRVDKLNEEKKDVNNDYLKIKSINQELKSELKKVVDEYNEVANKYRKLKDECVQKSTQKSVLDETKANLLVLQNKYNVMKKDFLDRLEELSKENIELANKVNVLNKSNRISSSDSNFSESSQDRADYYRLKYNNEVKMNNDLRVINDYLNRVMRASSQQLRLDLFKLGSETNNLNYLESYDYYLNNNLRFSIDNNLGTFPADHHYNRNSKIYTSSDRMLLRNKFKAAALVVKSCVRMKQVANRSRMDKIKINYLQKKIAMDKDRITW